MKSYSAIIQMKVTEQYFIVALFITLHKVVLTFESVDETLKCDHSNESCFLEHRFLVLLFIVLYKLVLYFRLSLQVKTTRGCDHSFENC